ncbi:MAG: transcriptional repressor [Acidimicrobiales bacterium]|nr:transcriptional repressor [Acidimicrobiales bacterium]
MNTEPAELLRSGGHRVTDARLRVWSVLADATDHLTAEEVAAAVGEVDPSINLASVYRSLALFEEMGAVRQSRLGSERVSYWELGHPDEHFHLVCRVCGSVDHHRGSLVGPVLEHLRDGHGFAVERIELTVTGVCTACGPLPNTGENAAGSESQE